ncbi:winged helix-turn-helix transcriptional regulator [Streptomyces mirabilis]|uniref:winged helix-turn-helix transcriptional regulator n=1 Tax=Streptomyces mirabilis TaxID=68239 RepID=UPI003655FC41
MTRNTLADRLYRLVEEGLLEKRPYQTEPVRHDYELTEMGYEFHGALLMMSRWGDRRPVKRASRWPCVTRYAGRTPMPRSCSPPEVSP